MVHVTLTATICWSASQRSWVQLSRLVSCPDSWPQLLIVAGVRQSGSLTILPQLLQFSPCPGVASALVVVVLFINGTITGDCLLPLAVGAAQLSRCSDYIINLANVLREQHDGG